MLLQGVRQTVSLENASKYIYFCIPCYFYLDPDEDLRQKGTIIYFFPFFRAVEHVYSAVGQHHRFTGLGWRIRVVDIESLPGIFFVKIT